MLWEMRKLRRCRIEKARISSDFRAMILHNSEFSTGVDNFVENDTHPTAFVGNELGDI